MRNAESSFATLRAFKEIGVQLVVLFQRPLGADQFARLLRRGLPAHRSVV